MGCGCRSSKAKFNKMLNSIEKSPKSPRQKRIEARKARIKARNLRRARLEARKLTYSPRMNSGDSRI